MLFPDFFPRLQATAKARYGAQLTERTFRRWREKGLIPGPAEPKGRGRGVSPERRWPIAAYRRALRICRYQARGLRHETLWWIWLWLSGEKIAPTKVKTCLLREHRRARRAARNLAESGFLRSSGPTSLSAIPGGPPANPVDALFEMLVRHPAAGFTAELQRDLYYANYNELEPDNIEERFKRILAPIVPAEVMEFDVGDEIEIEWTSGHLSEGHSNPGDYISGASDADLDLARDIVVLGILFARLMAPYADLLGSNSVSENLMQLSMTQSALWFGNGFVVDAVFRTLCGIYQDRNDDASPLGRLALAKTRYEWAVNVLG